MQTQIEKTVAAIVEAPAAKPKAVSKTKPKAEKPATKVEAKPASKPAPAKAKTAKPAGKQAQASKVKASQAAAYSILPQMRPKAGRVLQAHTEAAIRLLGMYKKGAKVQRAALSRVVGDTAISYHIKNGSFESPEQGLIAFTDMGREAFAARVPGLDEGLVGEFLALFQTGKAGEKVTKACGSGIAKFIRQAA